MQNKGVSYIRISTEDQSNWSISGQERMNAEFAKSRGIEVVKEFTDDGVSAKNFDRPGWKACIRYIKENKDVNFLIIAKYDRLIRNASEGLAMIERLENNYNIKILSVQENFMIDPYSPYFFKMRADLLVTAEFERRIIGDRSRMGIWSARSQGRFIGPAPFGYTNARDESNKPIILIDPEKAPVVQKMFEMYLMDDSLAVIQRNLKDQGFNRKGKDAVKRILSNPTYAGLIAVPGWKDKPGYNTKGIHEAIVSMNIWQAAQYKLNKRQGQGPKVFRDEAPFRGLLYCGLCGHQCTAGESTGKSKKYWYYRCGNCNKSYNGIKVNADIIGIMHHLSIDERLRAMILEEAKVMMEEEMNFNRDKITILQDELSEQLKKNDSLEMKFITDMIDRDVYSKHSRDFKERTFQLQTQLNNIVGDKDEAMRKLDAELTSLQNLGDVFENSDPHDKYLLLRGCSSLGLLIGDNVYTTPELNKIFSYKSLEGSKLRINKSLIKEGKMVINPTSTRSWTIYQTLFDVLARLSA